MNRFVKNERERIPMKTNLTPETLARYFDQTLLKAYATEDDFRAFCEESDRYGFAMVAINSAPSNFAASAYRTVRFMWELQSAFHLDKRQLL